MKLPFRLDRIATVAFGGVVLAGLVLVAGGLNTARLERHLEERRLACLREIAVGSAPVPPSWFDEVNCEPTALVSTLGTTGIQAELARAQWAVWGSRAWPWQLAIAAALAGATPWVWYFVLRRIAELRQAVLGR